MQNLFSWRHAILKSDLYSTTKHVLLTLSCHMNDLGESCFPSVETVAAECSLSKRSVMNHLNSAKELGWLKVGLHGFGGNGWKRHEYTIGWPQDGASKKSGNDHDRRGESDAKGGELGAKGGESDDTSVVNDVHPNSTENSTGNSRKNTTGQSQSANADPSARQTKQAQKHDERASAFADWYAEYPKKVGKQHAWKAWKAIKPDAELAAAMTEAVRAQKRSAKARSDAGEFVPHWKNPATWLNGGCWDDEIPQTERQQKKEAYPVMTGWY